MSVSNEMLAYVEAPDSAYGWQVVREGDGLVEIRLTSQAWKGSVWEHRLDLFLPRGGARRDMAVLHITGDWPGDVEHEIRHRYADATGLVHGFLHNVPNQPLFEGLAEDSLVAHTFDQFLDTGDPEWPLLFPMVKSALRAMDAIQALCGSRIGVCPARFLVTGFSKRGWTSWLTAAADERVVAIAPMVYDNLNIAVQMRHQVEVWGGYSEQISDYTERDIQAKIETDRGRRLTWLVDPYSYRERLSLPKLIVNGANDRYWATDALNLYWDDLPFPKWILYIPNAGHGLQDTERLFRTSAAFFRSEACGNALPALEWRFDTSAGLALTVQCDRPAIRAALWSARSSSEDFRASEWRSAPMQAGERDTEFAGALPGPAEGFLAAFGEIAFEVDGLAFTLSTQIRIVGPTA